MVTYKHLIIPGKSGKAITLDVYFKGSNQPKPIVIFSHGFKGFKDWGPWGQLAEYFARQGLVFVKFNFSHNGVTPDHPDTFDDLEAFGKNTYSIELSDLNDVINWVCSMPDELPAAEADHNNISLIGHSRGGGVSIIKAAEDDRVSQLITWASISRLDYSEYFHEPRFLKQWEERGVIYVFNSRTLQEMPLNYTLYTDFIRFKDRLSIKKAMQGMDKPVLVIHGTSDAAVSLESAKSLNEWCPRSELFLIEAGDHTFGAGHPHVQAQLPNDLRMAADKTCAFILQQYHQATQS